MLCSCDDILVNRIQVISIGGIWKIEKALMFKGGEVQYIFLSVQNTEDPETPFFPFLRDLSRSLPSFWPQKGDNDVMGANS